MAASDTRVTKDAVLIGAADLAREAVIAEAGADLVGEHLGVVMDDDRVATHLFTCTSPAYVGWRWEVVVSRAPRARSATVCEVVLLPSEGAIVAPGWLPWSERVQPGDLGPGDVLPTAPDDPRLTAGLTGEDDLAGVASLAPLQPGSWEIGLGRVRVLSAPGRDDAADRWMDGDFGPTTSMARQAAEECRTCGFMLTIGGPLGQQFAICANSMSPADGRVVAMTYGCGAHSEVEVDAEPRLTATVEEFDPLDLGHS